MSISDGDAGCHIYMCGVHGTSSQARCIAHHRHHHHHHRPTALRYPTHPALLTLCGWLTVIRSCQDVPRALLVSGGGGAHVASAPLGRDRRVALPVWVRGRCGSRQACGQWRASGVRQWGPIVGVRSTSAPHVRVSKWSEGVVERLSSLVLSFLEQGSCWAAAVRLDVDADVL